MNILTECDDMDQIDEWSKKIKDLIIDWFKSLKTQIKTYEKFRDHLR